jgi:peptide/nickel transport system ATP-binding protein/oligopeptide transport system ATP-binding protein
MTSALLEVTDLSKHFKSRRGLASLLTGQGRTIPAVDGVSFYLKENETVGLVGESGCGKTTIGRTVLRLTDPTGGRILFGGRDITHLDRTEMRPLRREMQMIFQDLDAGLNPKMRVRDILREALTVFERPSDADIERRSRELLEQVNLKESKLASFPTELSGGEKRRVGIARVLAVRPRLIVADEPTSALDVSIQAQVVNLLRDLQKQLGETIARAPRHPYTQVLWSSAAEKRTTEAGVFDFERPASGCRFAPRCPRYQEMGHPAVCTDAGSEPPLRDTGKGHVVACHFA